MMGGLNTQPPGNLTYCYDAWRRRTSLTQNAGNTITYNYTAHRLTSIVKAPEGELTGFVYDAYGRLSRQNNANGTYTEYGYDGLDRVNAIAHRKSDTSVLTSESYNYSAASNLENMTVDGVTTNYGYERSSSIAACRDRSL